MKILILYYTKTGHALEAAEATAEGIRSTGSEADLVATEDFTAAEVAGYDGLILASPCWAGSVTSSGVARPLLRALDCLPAGSLSGKRCGAISVHAGMGGDTTVTTLGRIATAKGCKDFRAGPVAKAGVPFSLWTGPSVQEKDEGRFRAYGAGLVSEIQS